MSTLFTIPCYLVEMYPIVNSIKFVRLIIIRVYTIKHWFYLFLCHRIKNRYHTITTPHNISRPLRSNIAWRFLQQIINAILSHVLRIMVTHSYNKWHFGIIKYFYNRHPAINCRGFCHYVSSQYGNIRIFGFQYRTNSSFCFSTLRWTWCPM